VVVPLRFTPPKSTLQCPVAGHCIDHPATIDLSAVLGTGTGDLALPAHSHIVATDNSNQSEWWNVDVVGVKSLNAWNKIVHAKSDWELEHLSAPTVPTSPGTSPPTCSCTSPSSVSTWVPGHPRTAAGRGPAIGGQSGQKGENRS
jgi:hypothetical protein